MRNQWKKTAIPIIMAKEYEDVKAKGFNDENSSSKKKADQYDFSYLPNDYNSMFGGGYSTERKGRKQFYKYYYNSGEPIKNIIIVDPIWNRIDTRKGFHLIGSEKQALEFNSSLLESAKKANLNVKLYSAKNLKKESINDFNERIILLAYLRTLSQESKSNMIFFDIDELDKILQKNNTKYIGLAGVSTVLEKHDADLYLQGIAALVSFLGTPLGVYMLAHKNYESDLFFALYDVNNKIFDFLDHRAFKSNTTTLTTDSFYYEYFKLLGKSKKLRK